MADAGRILIMPKGAYNPSVSYEMLDLVSHNKLSWLAKKNATGIEPSEANSEYWFRFTDNITDADTLDGQDASTFYSLSKYTELPANTDLNNVSIGNYAFSSSNISTLVNAPFTSGSGGTLRVESTVASGSSDWLKQTVHRATGNITYERRKTSSGWGEWRKTNDGGDADTVDGKHASDFAKKWLGEPSTTDTDLLAWLNKQTCSGGFIVQPSRAQTNNPSTGKWLWGYLEYYTSNRRGVRLIDDSTGKIYESHVTNDKWTTWKELAFAEKVLPLTGGTLTGTFAIAPSGNSSETRIINNSGNTHIRNKVDEKNYTDIVVQKGNWVATESVDGVTKVYNILHTGNSAKVAIQSSAPTDTSALWVW